MSILEKDSFAEHAFGRAALRKLAKDGPLSPDFRLFHLQSLEGSKDQPVLRLRGARFRASRHAAGRLPAGASRSGPAEVFRIPGTVREVLLTRAEIDQERAIKELVVSPHSVAALSVGRADA